LYSSGIIYADIRRKKDAMGKDSPKSRPGSKYGCGSPFNQTQRNDMTEKVGIIIMILIILSGRLACEHWTSCLRDETHCFCSGGLEKCVAWRAIRNKAIRIAKPAAAPEVMIETSWKVSPFTSGCISEAFLSMDYKDHREFGAYQAHLYQRRDTPILSDDYPWRFLQAFPNVLNLFQGSRSIVQ
jgi:hypothetical protein